MPESNNLNIIQPLRGTKDLLTSEYLLHEYIIKITREVVECYGYQTISTPIIEYSNIFTRTLGEESDVISKEIYTFLDKSNNNIALRPEFTASIMRAVISNNLYQALPLKFFSTGPLFRYDRPQAGRYRQFHQFNCEYIGSDHGALADAEVIKLAYDILNTLNLNDKITLNINFLGCEETRKIYKEKLIEYFSKFKKKLSLESQKRLIKNPLRILDSKDLEDQELIKNSPIINNCYSIKSKIYLENVLKYLDLLNIKYVLNPYLVRGLDYYSDTIFEFVTKEIGAQNTILAGGRYDNLSTMLGGKKINAIGFAAGIERIALMQKYPIYSKRPVVIIPIEENNINTAVLLADKLRNRKIKAILELKGKISKRIKNSNILNAKFIIFIGADEERTNALKIKNLDSREEVLITEKNIYNYLKDNLIKE